MSTYRFGPFSLDKGRYEIKRDGAPIELPRLPMEILILLLERDGHVLSRSEIASRIWPEADPADVGLRINTAVNRIRNSLGDDPSSPVYVYTVVGKGYRFVAPVAVINGLSNTVQASPAAPELPSPSALAEETATSRFFPGRRRLVPLLVVLIIAAAGGLFLRRLPRPVAHSEEPYSFQRYTTNQGGNRITAAAISPDGRSVVFADTDGVRLKGSGEVGSHALATPPVREVDRLAWFPDGRHLALSGIAKGSDLPQVWFVSTTGEAPVLWRSGIRRATPASVGTRLAFTDTGGSEVWVANAPDQQPRKIIQAVLGETFPVLVWAANGRTLLAARHQRGDPEITRALDNPTDSTTSYLALDSDSGEITAEVDKFRIDDACLKPDGTFLFSREEVSGISLWEAALDARTGAFSHPARQVQLENLVLRSLSIASTGQVAAVVRFVKAGIFVADLNPEPISLTHAEPVSFSTDSAYPHSWTPDSTGIYLEQQQENRTYRIFKQDLGSHDPAALASDPTDQAFPLLTPDRASVLFEGRDQRAGPYALYRVPAGGGKSIRLETNGPLGEWRCPQRGTTCVMRRAEDRQRAVFYVLDPGYGIGKPLLTLPSSADPGAWDLSADGSTLSLVSPDSEQPVLQIVNLVTGKMTTQQLALHSRVTAIHWAADQAGWFITTKTGTGSDLFYLGRDGKFTLLHQSSAKSWAIPSPDGRKLVFVDQNVDSNVWLSNHIAGSP